MNYLLFIAIAILTIAFSTFFGYIIPMMCKEYKFKDYWKKCPQCDKNKKKHEIYNGTNFWKYGGYCAKHSPKISKNIWFTILFTVISLMPFVVEFINTDNFFSVNSISAYIVSMMLVYAAATDIKGLVIPDATHIVVFLVGLFNMFYTAITTSDNSVYALHLIGLICVSLPFFLICLLGKGGFGDVKFFAALGILLGWKKLLLVFLLAVVFGLIYIVFKKITADDIKWKTKVPFGPFISLGTIVALNFGDLITEAYMRLF